MAFTGQVTFLPISLWVAIIRVPVWELGLLFEANDASENARNLKSLVWMDCILMVTSWCFLAS